MKDRPHTYFTFIITLILLFAGAGAENASSQTRKDKDINVMKFYKTGKDTVYCDSIPAVRVYAKMPKMKGSYWRKYYRDVHNFGKTYPYALMAKEILLEADSTIFTDNLSRIKKEKYLRSVEKELFKRFEKPLRNLTISQGRMLMKLIDREVGITSFNIIKDYRGGITAGFWQGVARLFGSDLKKPYDKDGEDARLEELVHIWEAGEYEQLYYSLFWVYPDFIPKPSSNTR